MSDPIDRRTFAATFAASVVLGSEAPGAETAPAPHAKATEAAFERDYPPPGFNPSWRKPQINRLLVQDFVIYAHMDLEMVKKLLDKEPALVNSDPYGAGWMIRVKLTNQAEIEGLMNSGAYAKHIGQ